MALVEDGEVLVSRRLFGNLAPVAATNSAELLGEEVMAAFE